MPFKCLASDSLGLRVRTPRLMVIRAPLAEQARLEPTLFRGRLLACLPQSGDGDFERV